MSIPSYNFLQANAARLDEPKKFVDALISTGRFFKDEHGFVRVNLAGEYIRLDSKGMFRELMLTGEFLDLAGDVSDQAAYDWMWVALVARRWTFPRLNPEKPWNPDKPLPVRHVGRVRS